MSDRLMTLDVETYNAEEDERLPIEEREHFDVCFVCTGNTCRSPMAEAYYNHAKGNGRRVAVSAGVAPHPGDPISPLAAAALAAAGIESCEENDYLSHVAREIDDGIFECCDRVVAMTSQIAFVLMLNFPLYASQITTLGEDVRDPYGGDAAQYEATLDQIASLIS